VFACLGSFIVALGKPQGINMCSLKAEIINRLEASFDQPKVVDAPRLLD